MSPETLELHVIETSNFDDFRAAFSKLSDQERKKLSKTAQTLYRHINRSQNSWDYKETSGASGRLNKVLKKAHKATYKKTSHGMSMSQANWVRGLLDRSVLALFAVAPVSALKSNTIFFRTHDDQLLNILMDRKPDWLGDWVDHQLDQDWPRLSFPFVFKLIENKLIEKPRTDAYFALYANHLMRTADGWDAKNKKHIAAPNISSQLRASSLLMSDVYSVFCVESMAFNTNSWLKKGATSDYETWSEALIKLESDGTLDRTKLLDESLNALNADLKSNQLSGVAKFHKSLKATKKELKQREDIYRKLLASPIAPVARFGLDQLSALHKQKSLNIEACLGELPIIYSLPTKSHAMAATKFSTRIQKSNPDKSDEVASVYMAGFAHENGDVQTASLEGLEKLDAQLSDEIKLKLLDYTDIVLPHLKGRLTKLAGTQNGLAYFDDGISVQSEEPPDLDMSKLSEDQKQYWGITELLKSPFRYAPISSDIMRMQVLHTVDPIDQIETQDELLSCIAAFIENSDDRIESERIAHGIATIPRVPDEDFQARVEPLKYRLKMEAKDENQWDLMDAPLYGTAIGELIKTYLKLKYKKSAVDKAVYNAGSRVWKREDGPMTSHFWWLISEIRKGKAPGRICTPTHQNGWICPKIWVQRLGQIKENDPIDLSYSLLRLAPDHRDKVANAISSLSEPLKHLAAFTLGIIDDPEITHKSNLEVWMSAARARDPLKDWTELFASLNVTSIPPGAVSPHNTAWYLEGENRFDSPIKFKPLVSARGKKKLFKRSSSILEFNMPAVMLGHHPRPNRYHYEDRSSQDRQWYPKLFPLYPAMSYRSAIRGMVSRIDDKANSFEPVHGSLDALFQKNRPWGELGHLVLALGMFGRDADAQGLSIDALIEGTESGQFDPYLMAEIFTKLSDAAWIKLTRPNPSLKQAAQVSKLHAFVLSEMLETWLPNVDRKKRGLGDCLDSLLFAASFAEIGLGQEIEHYLRGFSGSSKAAKISKELLKLGPRNEKSIIIMRHQAINARIQFINIDGSS